MADFLTAIPDLIEHIHSCVEFAQAYSKIDKNLGSDLEHARRVSQQIRLFWEVLESNRHLRVGHGIHDSLLAAERALEDTKKKLDDWKKAFNYAECQTSDDVGSLKPFEHSSEGSSSTAIVEDMEDEKMKQRLEDEGRESCGLNRGVFVFRRFFAGLSFRWIRRGRKTKRTIIDQERETKNTAIAEKGTKNIAIVETFHRVRFVTIGAPDLKEALSHMDRALDDLMRMFSLASMLSRSVFNADAQDFIEKARKRRFSVLDIQRLTIPSSFLEPLDIAYGKDAKYSQSLLYVTEGEFEGCLIDRRFVRHQVDVGLGHEALEETELVARLMAEDPQDRFGITGPHLSVLRCCGIALPDEDGDLQDIVFRIPRATRKPRTLRRALATCRAPNVAVRIELALRLATALHVLHSLDIIHKRVRPESVVLLQSDDKDGSAPTYGSPYLAGFCYSRMEMTYSDMKPLGEYHVPENVYYHPHHIGKTRLQAFQKSDDVYSLGVCLLEIGLWRSIARWDSESAQYVLDESWNIGNHNYITKEHRLPGDIWIKRKDDLISMAKEELPFTAGPIYGNVVVTCLEFVDGERKSSGPSKNVKKVDFISDVLSRLYEINV